MFQKGQAPPPRRNFAVGGKERVRVSAWKVTLPDGVVLELQGRFTSKGHVKLHVLDYLKLTKRDATGEDGWLIEHKPLDADLEEIRCGRG